MGLFRFSVIADFAPDLTRQQSETCNNLTLQLRNAHLSLATKGCQGIANLFLSNWGLSFTQLLYYVSCQFLEAILHICVYALHLENNMMNNMNISNLIGYS